MRNPQEQQLRSSLQRGSVVRRKPWFIRANPIPSGNAPPPSRPLFESRSLSDSRDYVLMRCLLGPGFTEFDHQPPLALRDASSDPNDPELLQALCVPCHRTKTGDDLRAIAKAKRLAEREQLHRELLSKKVPGRPRVPAAVRRWTSRDGSSSKLPRE